MANIESFVFENPSSDSQVEVEGVFVDANSFLEQHISCPLVHACEALGYNKPTCIQAACIPLALTGHDIYGIAPTGSGKTAVFALPALERLLNRPKNRSAIRVLISSPARESAEQVYVTMGKFAQFVADFRCCLVTKLQEANVMSLPDIVVATPGCMLDHLLNSTSVSLDELEVLIIDDADRLLELGWEREIHELVKLCPKRRQTMLFSATVCERVDELSKFSLRDPVVVDLSTRPTTLTEEVVCMRGISEGKQDAILLALCSKTYTSRVLVFSGTKTVAHRLNIFFRLAGLKAAELHEGASQIQRLDVLERFRKQEVDFLIATDVAVRGMYITGVQTVINFACPRDIAGYVRRMERVVGREGCAVTFVTDNDRSFVKSIVKRVGSKPKRRIVSVGSVTRWFQVIEQLEEHVSSVIQEETEAKTLMEAKMEATMSEKSVALAENMTARPKRAWIYSEHGSSSRIRRNGGNTDEICARPKPTWPVTENEKKLMVVAFCFGFFCLYTGLKLLLQ